MEENTESDEYSDDYFEDEDSEDSEEDEKEVVPSSVSSNHVHNKLPSKGPQISFSKIFRFLRSNNFVTSTIYCNSSGTVEFIELLSDISKSPLLLRIDGYTMGYANLASEKVVTIYKSNSVVRHAQKLDDLCELLPGLTYGLCLVHSQGMILKTSNGGNILYEIRQSSSSFTDYILPTVDLKKFYIVHESLHKHASIISRNIVALSIKKFGTTLNKSQATFVVEFRRLKKFGGLIGPRRRKLDLTLKQLTEKLERTGKIRKNIEAQKIKLSGSSNDTSELSSVDAGVYKDMDVSLKLHRLDQSLESNTRLETELIGKFSKGKNMQLSLISDLNEISFLCNKMNKEVLQKISQIMDKYKVAI